MTHRKQVLYLFFLSSYRNKRGLIFWLNEWAYHSLHSFILYEFEDTGRGLVLRENLEYHLKIVITCLFLGISFMRENVITCLFLGIMFMRNNFTPMCNIFTLMWNMIAKDFGPTCFTA